MSPDQSFPVPARAIGLLEQSGVEGNLAVYFDWGEYAIWHLQPGIKVGMDGRRETVYPDSADDTDTDSDNNVTISSGSDHVATVYDQLGRRTEQTDQRTVKHVYGYTAAGQLAYDKIDSDFTGVRAAVDPTVKRIGYTHDDTGRVTKITSYSDAAGSTELNEIKRTYSGASWDQVTLTGHPVFEAR